MTRFHIGTAAWAIPAQCRGDFPGEGSILERYARVLPAVEINSSFYREHQPKTYARWAASVPAHFRFSVKLSRHFTQETRLKETGARLSETLEGISQLGEKWGVLLIQLPPSLELEQSVAERFLSALRKRYSGPIAWEPRHPSWTRPEAVDLLSHHGVAKVIADPERCPLPDPMQRVETLLYLRLHGSPEIYKSKYPAAFIASTAKRLGMAARAGKPAWCIYDNTTFGHATEDALATLALLGRGRTTIQAA